MNTIPNPSLLLIHPQNQQGQRIHRSLEGGFHTKIDWAFRDIPTCIAAARAKAYHVIVINAIGAFSDPNALQALNHPQILAVTAKPIIEQLRVSHADVRDYHPLPVDMAKLIGQVRGLLPVPTPAPQSAIRFGGNTRLGFPGSGTGAGLPPRMVSTVMREDHTEPLDLLENLPVPNPCDEPQRYDPNQKKRSEEGSQVRRRAAEKAAESQKRSVAGLDLDFDDEEEATLRLDPEEIETSGWEAYGDGDFALAQKEFHLCGTFEQETPGYYKLCEEWAKYVAQHGSSMAASRFAVIMLKKMQPRLKLSQNQCRRARAKFEARVNNL